jgi:hypothetical protein
MGMFSILQKMLLQGLGGGKECVFSPILSATLAARLFAQGQGRFGWCGCLGFSAKLLPHLC